jgi:dephospho-CoA kinase
VRALVVEQFGPEILDQSGPAGAAPKIDRRALGAIVFASPVALRRLEAILHPRMRRTFERAIARTVRRGRARAVVIDAAILFEAGWNTLCDRIVLVDAPRAERLARLVATRGWSEETLARREAAQWPLERKRGLADAVVANDPGAHALEEQIRRLAAVILPPFRRVTVRSSGGGTRLQGPRGAASSGPDLPDEPPRRP